MSRSTSSLLIDIQNICFSYENSPNALQDLSLEIRQGEQIALVGHNGSGKSTLAKHLNGLHKPSSGQVLIEGQSTENRRTAQLAKSVALLFQNPDDQICKRTVKAEVAFGPQNLGYPDEKVKELVHDSMDMFKLLQHAELNPHDLGYSQRKRLALASVIAMDTSVIVLDEPTAGLDPQEIRMLESAMKKIKTVGKTVIVISHDMDFIAENTTRAICLNGGRKVFDGSILNFFPDETLIESCGLLSPQIARLSAYFKLQPKKLTPEAFIAKLADN